MNKIFGKKIKILGYANLSKLETLMDRHFLFTLQEASDEITQKPKTIKQLNDYIKKGGFTHILIPDENFHNLEGSLKDCKVPVVEFLQDHWIPWAIKRKKEYIINNGIKQVITFSNRFLEPYEGIANFYHTTVGYNANLFVDNNLERDIDVLVSGTIKNHKPWVYPVRNWLAKILPEIGKQEGINLHLQQHPGYFPKDGRNYEQEYATILNRTKIATGGSSHWRLPLKKLYEIPACGAILLSDIPFDDADFFRGRILEIDPKKITLSNYQEKLRKNIMKVLEHYDKYKKELQPFRTKEDRFNRSYQGRALEMRKIISEIN